ncbi:MAG: SusD/RagB family nutrient-binding outer membrane lipoprotein, partial [Cytophagaceae bacterium]|nr:SusD/RagB family nutrient-binding outer membrane lipoprotein [Cytophagaceae bacterium]
MARILKAYIFQWITDRWGDVPYSQALKGNENFSPAFDRQQDIYNDL